VIGFAGHQTLLYPELTAAENLRYYGRLYRVADLSARVAHVLEQVGLYQRRDEPVGRLSRGMQQRLSLARAILHDPPILLLDEPETGLDVQALQVLESAITGRSDRPRTVILTTHNLPQGLRLADKVGILVGGRLVHEQSSAHADVAELESLYRGLLSAAA
jgi:heme exporter protein A